MPAYNNEKNKFLCIKSKKYLEKMNGKKVADVVCQYHPKAVLIDDHAAGDVICGECGLIVIDRVIDVSAEWRSFSNDGAEGREPSRVGGPENKLLSSSCHLSTMIGPIANGRAPALIFDAKNGQRALATSDRILRNAYAEIASMAGRINMPRSIIDRANYLFKEVQDISNIRGRSTEAKAAACLYIACRQEGVPRTFKEICAICRTSKRDIGRCFKTILNVLKTNLDLIKSDDFMARFCSTLGLPVFVEREAAHIAKSAADMDLMQGKSPISVAAAAIYMASQVTGLTRTQTEVCDVAGVSDCTIRATYKDLRPHAKHLLAKDSKFFFRADLLPE